MKYLETEIETLKSIWKMGKADLVCLAEIEAGLSRAEAEKGTVTQLRLMIREIREQRETQQRAQKQLQLPKGSPGMIRVDLPNTCEQRGTTTRKRTWRRLGERGLASVSDLGRLERAEDLSVEPLR